MHSFFKTVPSFLPMAQAPFHPSVPTSDLCGRIKSKSRSTNHSMGRVSSTHQDDWLNWASAISPAPASQCCQNWTHDIAAWNASALLLETVEKCQKSTKLPTDFLPDTNWGNHHFQPGCDHTSGWEDRQKWTACLHMPSSHWCSRSSRDNRESVNEWMCGWL